MSGTEFSIEIQPTLPPALSGLNELADDLAYSWSRQARSLFYRLDSELWERCGHNPNVFLRRVSQARLDAAAEDAMFMEDYKIALTWYRDYKSGSLKPEAEIPLDSNTDLVAYFSAEFGFHESLPIYSGGLGILAGDHCKAASDLGIPFVAVGLLYHQGYFSQTIDGHGKQVANYQTHDFDDLPISPILNDDGSLLLVSVKIGERDVNLRLWQSTAGNITLYLLDSDVPNNSEQDRSITYRLYGGDRSTRIQQEIVLGIGGVRALRALGLKPNAWHINEGHSAFQIIERMREQVEEQKVSWAAALEYVASSTVFTTHTPVSAGHDLFTHNLVNENLSLYFNALKIDIKDFLALGRSDNNNDSFNMTAFALRGSRFHNGVSRIHGSIASKMESYVWPEIPPEENPIIHITNGVHVPTFLAREWANLFDSRFSDWHNQLSNEKFWESIDDIKDYRYWSVHQALRSAMLENVYKLVQNRMRRNDHSEATIRKVIQCISQPDSDVLVLGFARRFATYKRATLLFTDPDRLHKLLNNPQRPVLLIFAGKAHPQDEPGQKLIETIHHYSLHPDFIGKIILLEGYDMALARNLVTGVDVWINTPEYPLEACGTSGQKAGINGVINLSVLDGWWGEGYNEKNGWAVVPHETHLDANSRQLEESSELFDILEKQVIPTYFDRENTSYSEKWIKICKDSMKSIIPHFNSERMVLDYINKMYVPAIRQNKKFTDAGFQKIQEFSQWKHKIRQAWGDVSIKPMETLSKSIPCNQQLKLSVHVDLNKLKASDIRVQILLGDKNSLGKFLQNESHFFVTEDPDSTGLTEFTASINMETNGLKHFKIRIYPHHELLAHPYEIGLMKWL